MANDVMSVGRAATELRVKESVIYYLLRSELVRLHPPHRDTFVGKKFVSLSECRAALAARTKAHKERGATTIHTDQSTLVKLGVLCHRLAEQLGMSQPLTKKDALRIIVDRALRTPGLRDPGEE